MKKVLTLVLAAALICALLAGCGGASKGLQANTEYAQQKVSDFAHFQRRNAAVFADEVFCKAATAAMMITDKTTEEDFAKIARYLDLDSITVADETRTVIASYPEDEKGIQLKDIEEKKGFAGIVKNTCDKDMTDPVKNDETGEYSLLAGVKRSDGTGVVIIGLTTDEYGEIVGDNLAEKCGNNTFVLKDGVVISSTLNGVLPNDTLDIIKLNDDAIAKDTFSFTSDGKNYTGKSATAEGGYTVIVAEPA